MKEMLNNQMEYARKEIKKAYSQFLSKQITREEFNVQNAMWTVCIEECKKQLGDEYQAPSMEQLKPSTVNTKISNEDALREEIAELELEIAELCQKRIAEMTGAYNEQIRRANEDLRQAKEQLAKQTGSAASEFTAEEVAAVESMIENNLIPATTEVEEVVVEEVAAPAPKKHIMKNETKIYVPKKYHQYIDCIYRDVEGYRVELVEGFIFENIECGVALCDTQQEVLETIKWWIVAE